MRKKLIIVVCMLFLGTLVIVLPSTFGKKPFVKLSANEIVSAEIFIIPPNTTVKLVNTEDIAKLTEILNEIVIYREDDSGREYDGQLVQAMITLKNGEIHTIGAYGSFLFLNDKCYRTKYGPSEKLNAFGNGILNGQ